MLEKCHCCNKEVDYDLDEGLFCDDCADTILYESFNDILED